MRTSFTCETYSGEKFEDIAFRVTMRGELQTEKPVPDYIKVQILEAYKLYEEQNADYPEAAPEEEDLDELVKQIKSKQGE